MSLFIKSERKDISELGSLLERAKSIEDGYIIKEEIEEIKLEKYSGGQIQIKDGFYSLIVFNRDTEIRITRDGMNLYFRQISEQPFDDATRPITGINSSHDPTYYLKGKYDVTSGNWWESAFFPEFDYPREDNQNIPDESRAGLKVKFYRDGEGEVKYFRFCGYEVVRKGE
ncbi:MAG: hypothetical protein HY578_02670 [Nitrospinae bacterium]|nr:hypothetical protein [Nitrospinota bacterium]